ncbi:unnamed protein product [Brassica rapa subsp. narinosa]|uniref:(rape) hypothetical protein n=1 Tax=Brassica napus TaxID=3708 RepID=A0A816XSS4_BRANA|nr:unnamed protein product [Brassica napus]
MLSAEHKHSQDHSTQTMILIKPELTCVSNCQILSKCTHLLKPKIRIVKDIILVLILNKNQYGRNQDSDFNSLKPKKVPNFTSFIPLKSIKRGTCRPKSSIDIRETEESTETMTKENPHKDR